MKKKFAILKISTLFVEEIQRYQRSGPKKGLFANLFYLPELERKRTFWVASKYLPTLSTLIRTEMDFIILGMITPLDFSKIMDSIHFQ